MRSWKRTNRRRREEADRMTLRAIVARVGRLGELARGLAKEITLTRDADDPLL
jgi:hypothetical protein